MTIFDAGGQKQFIYSYFTDQWAGRIFSKVGVFIWVLDSSDETTFQEALVELQKALVNLKEHSPESRNFIIASKYDKYVYSLEDLRKKFAKWDIEEVSATSIPLGIAREIVCTILDGTMSPQQKLKVEELSKFLIKFNKKENASATMIVNKKDGLEIASAVNVKKIFNPKLKYLSIKSFIEPLDKAKELFIQSEDVDFAVWHVGTNYIIIFDLNEKFVLFSIIPERNFKIGDMLRRLEGIKEKIIENLD